jgi:nitroreductase
MSANFPDPETLRAVLTLATKAPSVNNSQPWRWRIGPDSLHLYAHADAPADADAGHHLPRTDADRRDLLLSCGSALHHCTVGLAAMGWLASIDRLPDPADPDHLAAIEMVRRPPGELDVMLAAAIGRRRTDRRNYNSWPVPWGDIALMGARAARAGVMLRQIDLLPRRRDLVIDPGRNNPDSPPGEDNAVMVALGTENDDDLARLRAGEATSLVLLSATAMGLASCLVTEPLEVDETREALRADTFGSSGHPQMLVRVGWAPVNADPLPATPRRSLPEVADWSNDDAIIVGPDLIGGVSIPG